MVFTPSSTGWRDAFRASRFFYSKSILQGSAIVDFEQSFARYIGVNRAASFARGRVALYAILRAMNIGPGDEVILPAYTCVAVPEAVQKAGATIVFADISDSTFNLSAETVAKCITPRTRAVLAQHTFGNPVELAPLLKLASQNGIKVIEDCATALGASYQGRKLGSWGDAALFSFDHSKLLSTEEGGMAVSRDPTVAKNLTEIQRDCVLPHRREVRGKLVRNIARKLFLSPATNWWGQVAYSLCDEWFAFSGHYRITDDEGPVNDSYNERLPNALAALGLQQLKTIDHMLRRRHTTANQYEQNRSSWLLEPAIAPKDGERIYPYFSALCDQRQTLLEQGAEADIYLGKFFAAVVHPPETPVAAMGYKPGSCPVAERVADTMVQLPTHPFLNKHDVDRVIALLNQFSCTEKQ